MSERHKQSRGATIAQKTHYKSIGEAGKLLRTHTGREMQPEGMRKCFVWDEDSLLNNAKGVVLALFTDKDDRRLIHVYQSVLYRWVEALRIWEQMPDEVLRRQVWEYLDSNAFTFKFEKDKSGDDLKDVYQPTRLKTTPQLVRDVVGAIRDTIFLDSFGMPPPFIVDGILPLSDQVVGRTRTVDLVSGQTMATSPAVFSLNTLPFDIDEDADEPERWLKFLSEVFPDDPQSIDCLQEFFGYLLSGRTDMQKALYMVGPKRSGKGTLMHVMKELVGARNVAGGSFHTLGSQFGLQGWLDKSLVLIPDVRSNRVSQAVIERLLTITGEDTITVHRKYLPDAHVKLGARVVMASNEAQDFPDESGALVSRLLTIEMHESFYGREDRTLMSDLRSELHGIATWAIAGMRRLNSRGGFTEPTSGESLRKELDSLGSPIKSWLSDECELTDLAETDTDEVRASYSAWCRRNGVEPIGEVAFGMKLRSATGRRVKRERRDSGGRSVYVGLRLRASSQVFNDIPDPAEKSATE